MQHGHGGQREDAGRSDEVSVLEANRQAVVVIHGIGHQRPMDTLRPFVDAVLGIDPAAGGSTPYYSKPDELSGTFELRRLQSRNSRPRTDYFELYWQHLVPTATWARIWAWIVLLLKRRADDVPPALRGLWRLTWVLTLAVGLLLLASLAAWAAPEAIPQLAGLRETPEIPAGGLAILLLVQGLVLNYVGDAAIYLSPEPRNVAARQAVRDAGVALLERLHAGLDDTRPYDRIVVVGHSLGSVIGYDILTYAWPRFNERHGSPPRPTHDALHAAETAAKQCHTLSASSNAEGRTSARTAWVRASRKLWMEQRRNGFPWLVSDFITLGSPLTHSLLLLARSGTEFARKKVQRELPTSPPQLEDGRGFSFDCAYRLADGSRRTTFALHHAAVFAVTRWSNLYFPARFGVLGDPIGGPLADVLGPGIIDIPVETASGGGWLAHTAYWRPHARDRKNGRSAILQLTHALDLRRQCFPDREPSPTATSPVEAMGPELIRASAT